MARAISDARRQWSTHRIYCRRRSRMSAQRVACYIRPRTPGEFRRGVWWVLATQHALIGQVRGQA